MSYSDFSLDRALKAFGLRIEEREDMFRDIPERPIGPHLEEILSESVPLAKAIHTEKARSEFIVAPILLELRRQRSHRISFFSGVEFNVAPERGLNGVCDFLVAKSPNQWVLAAPAFVVVEAKNDNIKSGLGQCVATMVAVQLFNEREGSPTPEVYGAVTTGTIWQFLRLTGTDVELDTQEHYIDRAEKIFGILKWIVSDEGDRARLVA